MDEAITAELCFNHDADVLPCKSFSKGLKQHNKITKRCVHHLQNEDIPRYLVVLAHHYHLSGKACDEFLEQDIKMHMKLTLFIRGLQK